MRRFSLYFVQKHRRDGDNAKGVEKEGKKSIRVSGSGGRSLGFLGARRDERVRVRDAFLAKVLFRIVVAGARDIGKGTKGSDS